MARGESSHTRESRRRSRPHSLLLRGADYSKLDPKSLSQTLAYTAKMIADEVTRLLEFVKGRADSPT